MLAKKQPDKSAPGCTLVETKSEAMIKSTPNLIEFNLLDFDEKAWHIWHSATYLMVRHNRSYRVNLYYMNGFYIQLWYHTGRHRIDRITATQSRAVLNPYLRMIDIEGLLN